MLQDLPFDGFPKYQTIDLQMLGFFFNVHEWNKNKNKRAYERLERPVWIFTSKYRSLILALVCDGKLRGL